MDMRGSPSLGGCRGGLKVYKTGTYTGLTSDWVKITKKIM